MSKKIYRIFILSILIFIFICNNKVFGVESKDVDEQITNWSSGGMTGWTDELKKEQYKKILANLKKDFGYTGETINEEMKMKTTISITKKSKTFLSNLPFVDNTYKYTIRVRKR